jgi:hypothetical protein
MQQIEFATHWNNASRTIVAKHWFADKPHEPVQNSRFSSFFHCVTFFFTPLPVVSELSDNLISDALPTELFLLSALTSLCAHFVLASAHL